MKIANSKYYSDLPLFVILRHESMRDFESSILIKKEILRVAQNDNWIQYRKPDYNGSKKFKILFL
jgi:hypothetical protein